MISVEEAKQIIQKNVSKLTAIKIGLGSVRNHVLAADIFAGFDIPAFPQSSMDGYAFSFNDWRHNPVLAVNGEIAAGLASRISLSAGTAARIFTGAAVPDGADTVVMQEKVKLLNGQLTIEDDALQAGHNVRPRGSEIKKGQLALKAGTIITPAAMGFLAGIGIADVLVNPIPSVSIIITGNELQQPGQPLRYGQVYEANSFALRAALHQAGIESPSVLYAPDDLAALTSILENALNKSDLVLLTGGVSVGDYDYVLRAAAECGVTTLFHKVKQRPGKPLFFGQKDDRIIFGLPGNPSSVLSCFYQYVLPAIGGLCGRSLELPSQTAILANEYVKTPALTHFLKGEFDGTRVTILDGQESYKLNSFARANCMVRLEEGTTGATNGDQVKIYLIPR